MAAEGEGDGGDGGGCICRAEGDEAFSAPPQEQLTVHPGNYGVESLSISTHLIVVHSIPLHGLL